MLNLLFNPSFFVGIFVAVLIVFLIVLMIKHPSFRLACFFILVIVYVFVTLYCVINLNIYYNASGGIIGEVTGLFSPTVSVEESVFNFDNLELVQYLDTDTYYCKITSNKVVTVDDEKDYVVYVNDKPCSNVIVNKELLSADYHYLFFDENNNLLCDDTLFIRFSFGTNESYCYVETKNGSESVQFWNYYFNRNNFVVSFKENNYVSDSEIKYGTGEIPQLFKVDYVYTENQIETKFYEENSKLELANIVGIENWTIDDVVVDETYAIQSDLTVKANFYDISSAVNCGYYEEVFVGDGTFLLSNLDVEGINNTGAIYFYLDENENEQMILFKDDYGWNSRCVSYNNNGCIEFDSPYDNVRNFVFDTNTKVGYWVDDFGFNYDYFFNYICSTCYEIVYSVEGQEGVYLYNYTWNTTKTLIEDGYWNSFKTKFDGSYVGNVVKISNSESKTYYTYNFVTDEIKSYTTSDDDIVHI